MVSWSRLASGFWNSENVDQYGQRIDKAIAVARAKINRRDADSYTYLYLGGALGFKGRFVLMQRKWIASFKLAYQAVNALKTCQEMDPENKDVLLGLGIFDYYTARLSGVTKFISRTLIRKGNKREGIRKLHAAADEALYSSIEAKSMLIHIYLFLESGYREARPLAEELSGQFKNNPRYLFLRGITYSRLGMRRDYTNSLDALLHRGKTDPSRSKAAIWKSRALYLQASDCLFRGQYDIARSLLYNIRDHADPVTDPSMVAWPLIKIGMSYDLEGQRKKALAFYNRVMKMENGAGAQFLAERFIDEAPGKGNPFIGY
jgi:tetratricopeptide (TPR) repeat protein